MKEYALNQSSRQSKIPELTLLFWITKICATTFGETAGDLLSMTLNLGYALSSLLFLSLFIGTLSIQLTGKRYSPLRYWAVIVATSTAGTTMSDYLDRSLGLGYAKGALLLMSLLLLVLAFWKHCEHSLAVDRIKTFRGEAFYWLAILFSNTLGTAFGDFLSDNSGLGFAGGAFIISGILALIVLAHYFKSLSPVLLFWAAFILTRPFGATFGDLLTKSQAKGGLDYGTKASSLILFSLLLLLIGYETWWKKRTQSL